MPFPASQTDVLSAEGVFLNYTQDWISPGREQTLFSSVQFTSYRSNLSYKAQVEECHLSWMVSVSHIHQKLSSLEWIIQKWWITEQIKTTAVQSEGWLYTICPSILSVAAVWLTGLIVIIWALHRRCGRPPLLPWRWPYMTPAVTGRSQMADSFFMSYLSDNVLSRCLKHHAHTYRFTQTQHPRDVSSARLTALRPALADKRPSSAERWGCGGGWPV